jgi:hypothetical protein
VSLICNQSPACASLLLGKREVGLGVALTIPARPGTSIRRTQGCGSPPVVRTQFKFFFYPVDDTPGGGGMDVRLCCFPPVPLTLPAVRSDVQDQGQQHARCTYEGGCGVLPGLRIMFCLECSGSQEDARRGPPVPRSGSKWMGMKGVGMMGGGGGRSDLRGRDLTALIDADGGGRNKHSRLLLLLTPSSR